MDCQWGEWTGWESCDVTCGGGTQTSTRVILKEAQHGGTACAGDFSRVQGCNTDDCPGMTLLNLFCLDNFWDIRDYWFWDALDASFIIGKFVAFSANLQFEIKWFSFSWLPIGTMDRMGILHRNMWWGNSDFHEGDPARSSTWRSCLCGRLNQSPGLQYKWLSRCDFTNCLFLEIISKT